MRLIAKLFLRGQIKAITGIAIGGSDTDVTIGGIDNSVIKDSQGVPYIPGSSLKGKIRSLLEKKEGKNICNCGECDICAIFGTGAGNQNPEVGPTRVYVRDAMINEKIKKEMENKEGTFKELELTYTEGKWENVIDRATSKAQHPRQTERVPAGTKFDFEMIFNILEDKDFTRLKELIIGLRLLEDDYIGSSGSRGYGRVAFENLNIGIKTIKEYETNNEIKPLITGQLDDFTYSEIANEIKDKVGKI